MASPRQCRARWSASRTASRGRSSSRPRASATSGRRARSRAAPRASSGSARRWCQRCRWRTSSAGGGAQYTPYRPRRSRSASSPFSTRTIPYAFRPRSSSPKRSRCSSERRTAGGGAGGVFAAPGAAGLGLGAHVLGEQLQEVSAALLDGLLGDLVDAVAGVEAEDLAVGELAEEGERGGLAAAAGFAAQDEDPVVAEALPHPGVSGGGAVHPAEVVERLGRDGALHEVRGAVGAVDGEELVALEDGAVAVDGGQAVGAAAVPGADGPVGGGGAAGVALAAEGAPVGGLEDARLAGRVAGPVAAVPVAIPVPVTIPVPVPVPVPVPAAVPVPVAARAPVAVAVPAPVTVPVSGAVPAPVAAVPRSAPLSCASARSSRPAPGPSSRDAASSWSLIAAHPPPPPRRTARGPCVSR